MNTRAAILIVLVLLCGGRSKAKSNDISSSPPKKPLRMNAHYIAGPQDTFERGGWLRCVRQYRMDVRSGLDLSIYDREDLGWVAKTFTCHFTFMYDRSFYNPTKGYTVEEFLADGRQEFGGYDAVLLWQGYPRLGFDERNQFDYYRDMPGGLEGLAEVVKKFHEHGVKVFIDYNPWDTGTRREEKSDDEALAELVAAIDADGVFLDTMNATSPVLRSNMDKLRSDVALVPEIHPAIEQLGLVSASWAQWLYDEFPPGMLHLKWIQPRHMQYQIRRWDKSHFVEIRSAFFNGSGMMIWENIFGSYNPWQREDRLSWRKAAEILHFFSDNFAGDRWEPFYPTLVEGLYAHRWDGYKGVVFTLVNTGEAIKDKELLEISNSFGWMYYDLWNGTEAKTEYREGKFVLKGSVGQIGCFAAVEKGNMGEEFGDFLMRQKILTDKKEARIDERNACRSVVYPVKIGRTKFVSRTNPPEGMVYVPDTTFTMRIEHRLRECGCHPDPGTNQDEWERYLSGQHHETFSSEGPGMVRHEIGPLQVRGFFIDLTEVTNAEFKKFLDETGYKPEHDKNFLKHWVDGKMPEELAEHPVVYVDLSDARAYARWAKKRLPTEIEWQLAAQGNDQRKWPWGEEPPDASRCNMTRNKTLDVRSCLAGRSPYGCYHMAGNVWEWTESCRDDGHTRFCMIRGGSYFNAEGSKWYVQGGPKPCGHHAKFIRMWPGLDRCATIGFRCVVDVK